jgi:hypothetical protein
MRKSANKKAIPIARDHGRAIDRKIALIITSALARITSSACVDSARPAALIPSHIPYAIVRAIGMKNVASAQYRGERRIVLMAGTAFCQDPGVGNGGGVGTGNGGAATEGGGGGDTGTV